MLSFEMRLQKLEYHQSLLLEMISIDKKPFYYLIIKAGLSEKETLEILNLCEELSIELEKQKAEGLVVFNSLLETFVSRLNPNLDLDLTIEALVKQNMFIPLMIEFKKLMGRTGKFNG